MDYEEYRVLSIKAVYRFHINSFLRRFRVDRPTVILLPGGMGSELLRSDKPFPASPSTPVDKIWLDCGITRDDALKIEIDGELRDANLRVVASNGPVSFLSQTPYDDFQNFAESQGWNYAVFGYDWRRPVSESSMFLKDFIVSFRDEVARQYGADVDPLRNTTLLCHSMGGLVVTAALRDTWFGSQAWHSVITVATPFYGTSNHLERYYVGLRELTNYYPVEVLTRIIGSLPGPYSLLFLPHEIFAKYGQTLGLQRYPLLDLQSGEPADPYGLDSATRWPTSVSREFVEMNRMQLVEIAAPLPAGVKERFFCLRATGNSKTAVELTWTNVNGASYDPGRDESPIRGTYGPGDGTVPAWSAFHADSPEANRRSFVNIADHGRVLESTEVMAIVAAIIRNGRLPFRIAAAIKKPLPAALSRPRFELTVAQAAECAKRGQPPPASLYSRRFARAVFSRMIL